MVIGVQVHASAFYARRKSLVRAPNKSGGRTQRRFGQFGGQKNLLPVPRFEARYLGYPVRSPVSVFFRAHSTGV